MNLQPEQLVSKIVKTLDSKQAVDITAMKISDLTTIGDYFVVASGNSNAQVKALAEEVENQLSKLGIEPKKVEGGQSALWILMDYYDVIVHIFYKETREFYSIERLWADAPRVDIDEILKSE
ncbi:MAG: ribosome silencing factor [Angelakisella sp.]